MSRIWSDRPPSKPGWYWVQELDNNLPVTRHLNCRAAGARHYIVLVTTDGKMLRELRVRAPGVGFWQRLEDFHGVLWAGPIPAPGVEV